MFLLRVSAAPTVSTMLAACSASSTRPSTAQSTTAAVQSAAAPAAMASPAAEPVVPEVAPAAQAAPVATPEAAPPTRAPVAAIATPKAAPKPIPEPRTKTPNPPESQATAIVAAVSKPSPTAISSLRGQVVLDAGANQSAAPGEVTDSVLYFLPEGGGRHAKPGNFLIYTHNKQFDPQLLVVPVGSTVKFPNQDEILHNVYSTTPGSSFDLGIYGNGGAGEYTFRKPGLVLVHCNVHEGMQADVLVLDTPYIARPKADGTFDLSGLPAGPGKLMLWHPRAARPVPLAISVPTAQHPVMHIAITRPRAPPHHDKQGKAYRAAQP